MIILKILIAVLAYAAFIFFLGRFLAVNQLDRDETP